ncbi:cysteine desulfurase DndA [Rhodococcus sp. 05-2256-B2]|uniref:cysteine desulfurase DndA n=1 Tax=unclassified Rhodococcus (in: high G+C Gram-positive bacteria) TaxID=192944 RepID=UPI000B9A9F64|nr:MULTISPECIES: cysteine desulfurase DndA [unclassified Rhodococcus (in: high G+C Gram-positive bacteria)]OZD87671.1 cysteine desulfurase DndA [Rhodococcus sp. 05-2256-B4]OZD89936.1 cysteine desulfurase DndA [Rhodococcus sp. 05-2256-B2]OZD92254.1 cysteine desulfurase DndA [Rhodococcus sp. 05-2256-B3]OZD98959.1 cysteine desulfurase DndA [Rhodococcus sp. 05-2256-B1]
MTIAPGTDNSLLSDAAAASPVYLDCNATTPIDPEVLAEVIHYLQEDFGNAGSRTHAYGQRAKERVNRAREQVAAPAGAKPDEVIFTSGATESNNLAILGLEQAGRDSGHMHIVTTQIEHKAVLEPIRELGRRGFEITEVSPNSDGWVSADDISAALRPDTHLVSVMAANNETGVFQPISDIAACLTSHGAFFHVDGAQAYGKVADIFDNSRIDLISLSGHKVYAPKGIGALIARRRGYERIPLSALFVGGGQERGLRPGTLPVPLIAGLGTAIELAGAKRLERKKYALQLREQALTALAPLSILINGDPSRALPHTLNFSVPGLDSEAALVALKGTAAISNGSACTSQAYEPSHVLVAMDLGEDRINGALRLSWCHLTPRPDWLAIGSALERIRHR